MKEEIGNFLWVSSSLCGSG